MTAAPLSHRTASPARGGYGFRTVAQMEWRKLRTVRSTWYIVALFAASMIGLAMLVLSHEGYAATARRRTCLVRPDPRLLHRARARPVAARHPRGATITAEFSSGMIRATFAAVPRRPLVLAAKAAVLGAVTLAAGEISAFAAFLAGQATLQAPAPHATLGQPGVLRAVLMAGAYPALIALIGLGIGASIRHTAGAICALVGVLFVLPLVFISPSHADHGAELPAAPDGGQLADRGQAGGARAAARGDLRPAVRVCAGRARGRGLGADPSRRLAGGADSIPAVPGCWRRCGR